MQLQWPLKLRKKKKESEALEHQFRIEAGMTQIKGTEFLMKRIEYTDEFFDTMSQVFRDEVAELRKIKARTVEQNRILELKQLQVVNIEMYRQLRKAGVAWSVAKEDNDMSERYSALEKLFTRNWDNPKYQKLLNACILYLGDISFGEKHVEPSPTLLVQNPQGSTRLDVSGFGHKEKED